MEEENNLLFLPIKEYNFRHVPASYLYTRKIVYNIENNISSHSC